MLIFLLFSMHGVMVRVITTQMFSRPLRSRWHATVIWFSTLNIRLPDLGDGSHFVIHAPKWPARDCSSGSRKKQTGHPKWKTV